MPGISCLVPECMGNYIDGPVVSTFGFPRDETLRRKWLSAIFPGICLVTKHDKVCELHFDNIKRINAHQDFVTGKIYTESVKSQLTKNSVPTIFPARSSNLPVTKPIRKRRNESNVRLEEFLISALGQRPINSVEGILKAGKMNVEDLVRIKRLGRQTPELRLISKSVQATKRFNKTYYDRNKWMCGCAQKNAFFCFPCLLVLPEDEKDINWARIGVTDLSRLQQKVIKHQNSKNHLRAHADFVLLGKEDNSGNQSRIARRQRIDNHNQVVEKNRSVMRKIIRCIKFCSIFQVALEGNDEKLDFYDRLFEDFLNYTYELDALSKRHSSTASLIENSSKIVRNQILDCMLAVCQEEISKQISEAEFAIIEGDGTSDICDRRQKVLVLRYIHKGNIFERFWSFARVPDDTEASLASSIQTQIDPILKTNNNLIPQTTIRPDILSGSVAGAKMKIREKYPFANFFRCYVHQFDRSIQRLTEQVRELRIFFSNLSEFSTFFSSSSHRCDVLRQMAKSRPRLVSSARWNCNARAVHTVHENLEELKLCFREITERCEKSKTVNDAMALGRILNDNDFIFWLNLFGTLLPDVDVLFQKFVPKEGDGLHKHALIFEEIVSELREETGYIEVDADEVVYNAKRHRLSKTDRNYYVYKKEISDDLIDDIKGRLYNRPHLQANALIDNELFQIFDSRFPEKIFERVTLFYPMLDKERLKTELEVIYSMEDFGNVRGAINLLKFVKESELEDVFAETTKLLKTILTTPMNTSEAEFRFSTLKRTRKFLSGKTANKDHLLPLAMMTINSDLVRDIGNFEDRVLDKFVKLKNNSTDFIFESQ